MPRSIKTSPTESEASPPNENLRHWRALGTTDPAHTKQFKRAGGFSGTAVKPIWTEYRMTEHFGPCGIGWGMERPEFESVTAGDELLVFCTVEVWYSDGVGDSATRGSVYGVGGDKVIVKQQRGLVTDDEAYKKAYTDALSNAMKHIGVAADVHMGLFDDSKYVAEARAEYSSAGPASKTAGKPAQQPLHLAAYEEASKGSDALRAFWGGLENREKRDICQAMRADTAKGCPASLKQTAEQADARQQILEQGNAAPLPSPLGGSPMSEESVRRFSASASRNELEEILQ